MNRARKSDRDNTAQDSPRCSAAWRCLLSVVGGVLLAAAWSDSAGRCSASQWDPTNSVRDTPFLRLREATLEYHGAEDELTNLTEIRIGWFGPTNADESSNGDLWRAASLAVREANQSRAVKPGASFAALPFRLVPRWALDPWGTGISQLSRMVYDEQPLALLGSVDSATTHLAEQVVAKANLPLVSPIATDKSVTLAGVSWMFSCAPSDAVIARILVTDILSSSRSRRKEAQSLSGTGLVPSPAANDSIPARDPGRIALLTCTDHASRMTTREVLKEFALQHHVPDFRFEVPPRTREIAQQINALTAAQPAVVLIIADPEDSAHLVLAVREAFNKCGTSAATADETGGHNYSQPKLKCVIYGTHTMAHSRFLKLAGKAAEGIRFPLLYAPESTDPMNSRFVASFVATYQHAPDYTAALVYDATRLLLAAIDSAGPSRTRLRERLRELTPWSGIAGPIFFDGTGQNTRTNVIMGAICRGAVTSLTEPMALLQSTQSNTLP
jgi:branched-chain amino acid transport system substrate-binding protein